MTTITIKGTDYQLRNKGSEVTLNELSKISLILENTTNDYIGKWLQVLEILGCKAMIEDMTAKQFTDAVKEVNITDVKQEIVEEIEVNNRAYACSVTDGVLDVSARDLSKIEKLASKGSAWGHKAFAVVYKDVNLTNNEHYDDAHIDYKAKLFGEGVNADVAAPVIFQLSKAIVENVQALMDAQSTSV